MNALDLWEWRAIECGSWSMRVSWLSVRIDGDVAFIDPGPRGLRDDDLSLAWLAGVLAPSPGGDAG